MKCIIAGVVAGAPDRQTGAIAARQAAALQDTPERTTHETRLGRCDDIMGAAAKARRK